MWGREAGGVIRRQAVARKGDGGVCSASSWSGGGWVFREGSGPGNRQSIRVTRVGVRRGLLVAPDLQPTAVRWLISLSPPMYLSPPQRMFTTGQAPDTAS